MYHGPKVIGHMEPCLAQLVTLSSVDKTYSSTEEILSCMSTTGKKQRSPARFCGCSRLNWFDPRLAISVTGVLSIEPGVGITCSACLVGSDVLKERQTENHINLADLLFHGIASF